MEKMPQKSEAQEVPFPDIASEINAMGEADQAMRVRNHKEPGTWDFNMDAKNTARMKQVIAQIGWPTVSKVGKDASYFAWLLVQHADHDPAFQRQCIDLMRQEPQNEVQSIDMAMLEDRVRVNSGKPQLYGTQFHVENGQHVPLPIEDPEHADERRAEVGMPPLKEGIGEMYKVYGTPPQG